MADEDEVAKKKRARAARYEREKARWAAEKPLLPASHLPPAVPSAAQLPPVSSYPPRMAHGITVVQGIPFAVAVASAMGTSAAAQPGQSSSALLVPRPHGSSTCDEESPTDSASVQAADSLLQLQAVQKRTRLSLG